jgi:hypothetical protein
MEPPWIPETPPVSQTEHLIYKEKNPSLPSTLFPSPGHSQPPSNFPPIASTTYPWAWKAAYNGGERRTIRAPAAPSRRPSPFLVSLLLPVAPPSLWALAGRPHEYHAISPLQQRIHANQARRRRQGSSGGRRSTRQAERRWRGDPHGDPGGYRVPGVGGDGGRFPPDCLAGIGGDGDWRGSGRGRWSHTRPYPSGRPRCHLDQTHTNTK